MLATGYVKVSTSWAALPVIAAALVLAAGQPAVADARLADLRKAVSEAERRDDMPAAIRNAEEALRRVERLYGRTSKEAGDMMRTVARLYRRAGKVVEAEAMERRLQQIETADGETAQRKKAVEPTGGGAASGGTGGAPRSVTLSPPERPRPPAASPAPAPVVGTAPPPRPTVPERSAAEAPRAPGAAPVGSVAFSLGTQVLDPAKFAEVPVFFGTNRAAGPNRLRDGVALATFTSNPAPELKIGEARVSVPRQGRDAGEIPRPRAATFWRAAEKEDPNLHFTMVTVSTLTKDVFVSRVNARLAASSGDFKDQAFVFVHGFNVAFDDAVYRTAQIAYDLDFSGAPFVFSWPTLEGAFGYVGAKDRALASRVVLRDFLDLVSQSTKAKRIHLIAHSMGTWPLLDVLREIAVSDGANRAAPRFSEVVLIAPDMDRDNFATLASRVCPVRDAGSTRCSGGPATGMTFYATSNDRALLASVRLASGIDRAGLFDAKRPFIVKNIDTIDVSAADTSVFAYNHSQPLERRHLLTDIGRLLAASARPPHTRTLNFDQRRTDAGETYWSYQQR